jgi:Transglycosylase SLT domain.
MKDLKDRLEAFGWAALTVLCLAATGTLGGVFGGVGIPKLTAAQKQPETEPETVGPELPDIEEVVFEIIEKPLWVTAFAMTESSMNPRAYNKNTDAVGYLQITPVVIQDLNEYLNLVNRTRGIVYFTLKDRWDKEKSARMFWLYLKRYKANRDLREACRRWYGSYSKAYYNSVKSNLDGLLAESAP